MYNSYPSNFAFRFYDFFLANSGDYLGVIDYSTNQILDTIVAIPLKALVYNNSVCLIYYRKDLNNSFLNHAISWQMGVKDYDLIQVQYSQVINAYPLQSNGWNFLEYAGYVWDVTISMSLYNGDYITNDAGLPICYSNSSTCNFYNMNSLILTYVYGDDVFTNDPNANCVITSTLSAFSPTSTPTQSTPTQLPTITPTNSPTFPPTVSPTPSPTVSSSDDSLPPLTIILIVMGSILFLVIFGSLLYYYFLKKFFQTNENIQILNSERQDDYHILSV